MLTHTFTDFYHSDVFAVCPYTVDEGFPSMDEHLYYETSKHTDNCATSSYDAVHETYEHPINGHCAKCGGRILDQYFLLANEQIWHASCLRCAFCGCDLQWQTSCFYHKGYLLCRQDYFNCTTCPTCGKRFQEGDLVLPFPNGLSFHCECLRCRICAEALQMGDQCFMEAGEQTGVSCLACYQRRNSRRTTHYRSTYFRAVSDSTSSPTPITRNTKFSTSISVEESILAERHISVKDRPTSEISTRLEKPQKRIRTSFKHDQLRLMKAYFKVNQNPDSKDLRQLSAQTSLSKRVLQVWFQNARAKFRRWTSNTGVETNDTRGLETQDNQSPSITDTRDYNEKDGEVLKPWPFDSSPDPQKRHQ